jgi:hypothetical protein
MKVAAFALTSHKNQSRWQYVRELWGRHFDAFYFASDYAPEGCDASVLALTRDDSYGSNEIKEIRRIQFAARLAADFDWFFFGDDDTFVNVDRLYAYLSQLEATGAVVGHVLDGYYTRDPALRFCSGGAGFCMSTSTLTRIAQFFGSRVYHRHGHRLSRIQSALAPHSRNAVARAVLNAISQYYSRGPYSFRTDCADVAVGAACRALHVPLHHSALFRTDAPARPEAILEAITVHCIRDHASALALDQVLRTDRERNRPGADSSPAPGRMR